MSTREWFYVEAGSPRGPHTVDEVGDALRRLGPSTLVWRSGWAEWVPAGTVPELSRASWPASPGVPPRVPRASRTVPVMVLVIALCAVGVAVLITIGIIAAIAIPSLLRARVSANEAGAIGNVRTVISAQAAYQSVNQGLYDGRWECLARPQTCIPDYAGPTFIDAGLFEGARSGYVHELHGGARPAAAPAGASPSSTDAFAVIAYPAAPGKTGNRAFCGDATGRVCAIANGTRDALVAGSAGQSGIRCADVCGDLR